MEKNPIARFREVFDRASKSGLEMPDAVALGTVGAGNRSSVRMVLLKGFDDDGFVFYTNLESNKGRDIAGNPNVALCFWWPILHEQVRIEGPVTRVSDAEADAYFATRDRDSQIGAWASQQSRELGSREALQRAFDSASKEYSNRDVPRPSFWSGFRLKPECIEFWLGRPHRLHERYLYTRKGADWTVTMLYP
jgi:pyridoxamine 5'-phosphate oxidase